MPPPPTTNHRYYQHTGFNKSAFLQAGDALVLAKGSKRAVALWKKWNALLRDFQVPSD